jgi:SAM-dependent methyltransferase
MTRCGRHPVDRLSDEALRDVLLRVDVAGFPSDLEQLWSVEGVRYRETLRRIPPAVDSDSVLLDLGGTRAWWPFFQLVLGYRRIVANTNYPDSGFVDETAKVHGAGDADVRVSVYDIEREEFPHEDESFDVVLCLEVLEHLCIDPMGMMAEVNRVLKPGGTFVLTTPNAVRTSNVVSALLGEHPYGWAPYNGFDGNRHNREYTPAEIERLFRCAGITPTEVTTFGSKRRGLFRDALKAALHPILGAAPGCPWRWRRDVILAAGTETSTRVERRPSWLYFDMAERAMLDRKAERREIAGVGV